MKRIFIIVLVLACIFTFLSFQPLFTASAQTNATVYQSSYSSTVIDIWEGLINNNIGKDYVAFRSSQYEYYIFFGEDFEYKSGRITGTGNYYRYYSGSYNDTSTFTYGTDSFSVNPNSWYIYTNVTEDFPSLGNERSLIYEQIQIVSVVALLIFGVVRWIFIGR